MSNKPREIWIDECRHFLTFSGWAYNKKPNHVSGTLISAIEKSDFDKLSEELAKRDSELAELKAKHEELLSYLPSVPTDTYEKQLAKENAELKQALAELKLQFKGNLCTHCYDMIEDENSSLASKQKAVIEKLKEQRDAASKSVTCSETTRLKWIEECDKELAEIEGKK